MGFGLFAGRSVVCAALLALSGLATAAVAQDSVTIKVGAAAGGGYDNAGRLISRHLGRFLEGNPNVIVQNVEGAGSVRLAKMLSVADDPNELGMIISSRYVNAALDPEKIGMDLTQFQVIGSLNSAESICMTGKDSGIETFEDFVTQEFKVGGTTQDGGFYKIALMIRTAFGGKYQIITGFKGIRDIEAAIDRGELAGYCGSQYDAFIRNELTNSRHLIGGMRVDTMQDGKVVPSISSRVPTELDRVAFDFLLSPDQIYYPVMMSPLISADAVAKYRAAFDAMVVDPEFVAEATELLGPFNPLSSDATEAQIQATSHVSAPVLERARELVR
jgi:tripartite-type tricarboxylate transporter receptor subunit TctC